MASLSCQKLPSVAIRTIISCNQFPKVAMCSQKLPSVAIRTVIRATFVGFVLFLGGFVPFYWKQIHWGNCGKLWPSFWEALALFMGNRLIVGGFDPFYWKQIHWGIVGSFGPFYGEQIDCGKICPFLWEQINCGKLALFMVRFKYYIDNSLIKVK